MKVDYKILITCSVAGQAHKAR